MAANPGTPDPLPNPQLPDIGTTPTTKTEVAAQSTTAMASQSAWLAKAGGNLSDTSPNELAKANLDRIRKVKVEQEGDRDLSF